MLLIPLLACTAPDLPVDSTPSLDSSDSQPLDSEGSDTEDTDTEEPVDTGPFDGDEDGSPRSEDCDDANPDVHPGAEEIFDGYDNDCDGVIDAVGDYSGKHSWSARAWYEGKPHDFELSCPTTLSRALVDFDFTVTCTTDAADEWAALLIGATLTLTPDDPYLWELDRWEGDVIVTSSNGWDTRGRGSVVWNAMDSARITTALDTNYLDFSGTGKVNRK